jgi:hypothetical protein
MAGSDGRRALAEKFYWCPVTPMGKKGDKSNFGGRE